MKISEITEADVCNYIRCEQSPELPLIMSAALSYIKSYTGLTGAELDEYAEMSIAYMVLCQDMHDNRALYVEGTKGQTPPVNKVIDSILGMHSINLL